MTDLERVHSDSCQTWAGDTRQLLSKCLEPLLLGRVEVAHVLFEPVHPALERFYLGTECIDPHGEAANLMKDQLQLFIDVHCVYPSPET